MKTLLLALLAIPLIAVAVRAEDGVVYVPSAKATAVLKSGGQLVATDAFAISFNRRTSAGQVEVHDRDTDTFYVLEGDATVVVGGTMVGGTTTAPNQQRGTSITGGTTYQLRKGDVIAIPAGVPHWFKDVPALVVYYTVKVTKP
jgi:mannose-6-phosphate isomerase-like protein (cupin superfamily)